MFLIQLKFAIKLGKKNKNFHYSIAAKENYSIIKLAKLFGSKIKYLPKRPGERYLSVLKSKNLDNKIHKITAKIKLKTYIKDLIQKHRFTKKY